MRVDPERARARGLDTRRRDEDYYFCSPGCKAAFEQRPEDFVQEPDPAR